MDKCKIYLKVTKKVMSSAVRKRLKIYFILTSLISIVSFILTFVIYENKDLKEIDILFSDQIIIIK